MKWFGIPVGLGLVCLSALQLERTIRRERKKRGGATDDEQIEPSTWQVKVYK